MLNRLRKSIEQFRRAERGVAVVEFALILPIMLAVYIGTVEASTLIIVDRKVQSIAGSVGDLVARSDGKIEVGDLEDYFRAASSIMAPYPSDGVLQVVTAINVNADGTTDVAWQGQYQNGSFTQVANASLPDTFPLPVEMTDIARNNMVIAAEASYAYTPLFGIVIDQSINLYRSNFFMTRFGDDVDLVP